MASLGLEMDDLSNVGKEGVEKDDWLDDWMGWPEAEREGEVEEYGLRWGERI